MITEGVGVSAHKYWGNDSVHSTFIEAIGSMSICHPEGEHLNSMKHCT